MKLNELRNSSLSWAKELFPDWPEYVVQELIYNNLKDSDRSDYISHLQEVKRNFEGVTWQLENIFITIDVFDTFTQSVIKKRMGGSKNPWNAPNDLRRHLVQMRLVQQRGISKEPIIARDSPDGLALFEGFHRTIQHLKAYPEGYNGPIYIGYF